MTLQQIRAGINSAGAAAAAAIASVMPSSSSLSAPSAADASTASSPSPSPSPRPPAVAVTPLALTLAMRRAALGDAELAEGQRRYLQVDVSSLKKKRTPQLCFSNVRHSLGRVLELICDEAGIHNDNHAPSSVASKGRLVLTCLRLGPDPLPAEFSLTALNGVLVDGDTIIVTRQQPASAVAVPAVAPKPA